LGASGMAGVSQRAGTAAGAKYASATYLDLLSRSISLRTSTPRGTQAIKKRVRAAPSFSYWGAGPMQMSLERHCVRSSDRTANMEESVNTSSPPWGRVNPGKRLVGVPTASRLRGAAATSGFQLHNDVIGHSSELRKRHFVLFLQEQASSCLVIDHNRGMC